MTWTPISQAEWIYAIFIAVLLPCAVVYYWIRYDQRITSRCFSIRAFVMKRDEAVAALFIFLIAAVAFAPFYLGLISFWLAIAPD